MVMIVYEARMRHQRCRTSIGLDDARGTPLPVRSAESGGVMPCGFFFFLPDSHRLGRRNRRFKPKFKKKTKKTKVQNAPFEPIIKPYWRLTSHKHSKLSSLPLSHSVIDSLVSHSLYALISTSVSACCETLSQCRVNHLTHNCNKYLSYYFIKFCII